MQQQLITFNMWQKTLILLIFNTIYFIQCNKNGKNTLKNWFDQVKLPSFTCPPIKNEIGMKNGVIPPLVKVVDCTEPGAIYQYDYKVIDFNLKNNNNLHLEVIHKICKNF